ncbi:MAG TPA: sensor histidine kinase [Anaerolineaceae bacterium]|jgi:signal transduction histidine kinase
MRSNHNQPHLLHIPAFLGLIVVGLGGILDIQDPQKRVIAIPLVLIFGVLFLIPILKKLPNLWIHLIVGLMTACVCGLILIEPGWGFFPILFFLLDPVVMIGFPLRAGLIWTGVFALATGVIFALSIGWAALLPWSIYTSGFVFFGIFGYGIVQAERERKHSEKLLIELQDAHQRLQEYAGQLAELTIAQERNRIAREMHDTLGHRLTVAAVQLEGAQRLVRKDPERAETMIATVRDQVREGLSDLRRTVAMLRASLDEDMPIGPALEKLVSQMGEATGLKIHLSVQEPIPELPAAYRQALYRAAQEGLTNIQRHAQASEAWMQLGCQADHLTMLVGDNGVGIASTNLQAGFGLNGLRERAALLGGELFVDPRTGGGTQLSFRLPLPQVIPPREERCL